MGWYLYSAVSCEVVLCAVAFGRFRVWAAAAGTLQFGPLDLYGMHLLAIPYYTGMIAHRANGSLGALHLGRFQAMGFGHDFARLAANKCAWLSPPLLIALWILYWAATLIPMVLMVLVARPRQRIGS